jgi:hypothetical protein
MSTVLANPAEMIAHGAPRVLSSTPVRGTVEVARRVDHAFVAPPLHSLSSV